MKVTISGKNLQVRDELKEAIIAKLSKFDRYFHSDVEANATFSHIKHQQIVELTIPLKNGVILRAEESSDSMQTSIDRVVDKIARQVRKHKTALEKRYRQHETIRFEEVPDFDSEKEQEEEQIRIVKSKRFALKPMDPEEAVMQMELLHHDFYVFLNGESDEVNVVYKRKKGQYGLIEPRV